ARRGFCYPSPLQRSKLAGAGRERDPKAVLRPWTVLPRRLWCALASGLPRSASGVRRAKAPASERAQFVRKRVQSAHRGWAHPAIVLSCAAALYRAPTARARHSDPDAGAKEVAAGPSAAPPPHASIDWTTCPDKRGLRLPHLPKRRPSVHS